ncbi:MAG: cupin-like domain-containing protein [Symploca sp. SIO2D2]|nr:cupin-like domain-containing protein [Symploca sp. SIO2D2]
MNENKNNHLQTIDILEKTDISMVVDKYILANKPVLIRGLGKEWVAYKKWTSSEFVQRYGETEVIAKKSKSEESKTFSLSDYLVYIQITTDEEPYYLSDWSFSRDYPELLNDYIVPDCFENWIRRIPQHMLTREDDDYFLRWIYMGPTNTGSPMHRDVLDTSAWNVVLSGKKEWLFYPPDETENLYDGAVDGFNVNLNTYPRFKNAKGYTCIQEKGDLIFTPHLWWHQVRNIEGGISLTENFINDSNIDTVAKNYLSILGQDEALDHVIREYIPEMIAI